MTKHRTVLITASLATLLAHFAPAPVARADIYQWEYINPANPALGKQPSTTLAPDGAGVNAAPGADFFTRNLTMAYLIGADLTGAFATAANLTNADLSQANLTNAYFHGYEHCTDSGCEWSPSANLTNANLSQANATNANFAVATLTNANLSQANLTNANLSNATMTGASFSQANLTNTIFYFATLTNADLSQAYLTNAHFYQATLTGANFTGAEVRGAGLEYTGLTAAQLSSTASYQARDLTGIGLSGNNLAGVNLAGQNLTNAGFLYATLTKANFSQANLTNANFTTSSLSLTGVDLTGANLSQANLTNANFAGEDMCGEVACATSPGANLTNANLSGADARGANFYFATLTGANTSNLIQSDGHIAGLDLSAGASLVVRDYDGNPYYGFGPIPIKVDQHLAMDATGTLRLVFDADPWNSTISFAPGISVTRGGALELTFASDVNLASQVGRTIDLFNWTSVNPTGAFTVSSPYTWNLSKLYTTGEVTLTALAAIPGDFNNNGVVDAADYVVWRKTDGTAAGYNTWRTHFGQPGGSGSVASANAAVPEPTTLVMLIVAVSGVLTRRRWRK